MKTKEQVLDSFQSDCLDGRDATRLASFFDVKDFKKLGLVLKEGVDEKDHKPLPWTKEEILKFLEGDVAFGFEKALNKRGISSSLMYEVVKMWNWILEEGLEDFDDYPMYGLPLFKATALKYGFENPIGDDSGSESKYNEDSYY